MTARDRISKVLGALAAEPPRTDVNRYAQLGPEAQALVDDHDQIALAELLVKAHDDLARARRELADRDAADSADAAAGSYANGNEHAIAHPQSWLHILFTSPDPTTANTSSLAIRDHLAAEFPGVGMRISSNVTEVGVSLTPAEAARLAQSGVDTPGCDCGHDGMGISWHGDDCPWRRSILDGTTPAPAATGATGLRNRIARAIHRYDNHHALSGNDIPGKHQLGEADFVLTELRLELAALAAYENAITWQTTCLSCARVLDSCYAETVRAEKAEAEVARVAGLYERWVKAGPPPLGASMARRWDRRLAELRGAIHGPAEQPAPRDPCPHCEASSDRIPRAVLGQHIADMHPDVTAAGHREQRP